MRELFLLLLFLGVLQAHSYASSADNKKQIDFTPPGQITANTEDPGSATRLLYEDPLNSNSLMGSQPAKRNAVNATPTCTDNMGMIYHQGAPGYDGCLHTFGGGTPPQLPGDGRNRSLGVTIGQ
jgi:hypothetical protein